MKRSWKLLLATALIAAGWLSAGAAQADTKGQADRIAARHAAHLPWNRGYYHTQWGQPVALVVPPTAHMESRWGWGVAQNTVTPIYHRYGRAYPGEFQPGELGGRAARPTPHWPSHTDQFGVYYIRGPWN